MVGTDFVLPALASDACAADGWSISELARIDATLNGLPDRGDRINALNNELSEWERRRDTLHDWRLKAPGTVAEVGVIIAGILMRRECLEASARADVLRLGRAS